VPTPSSDVGSSPKRIIPNISSSSVPRSSRVSGVRTSTSIAPVVQNSQPSVPSCSDNDYANGTQEVDNVSSNYKWDANVFVAHTCDELLQKVKWCMKHGVSLRVKAGIRLVL
jgi:hypothetical protein